MYTFGREKEPERKVVTLILHLHSQSVGEQIHGRQMFILGACVCVGERERRGKRRGERQRLKERERMRVRVRERERGNEEKREDVARK